MSSAFIGTGGSYAQRGNFDITEFGTYEQETIQFSYDNRFDELSRETVFIDATARDTGNTDNTTSLRTGLILGKITASGNWKHWDPTATDGSQNPRGILQHEVALDTTGSALAVKPDRILIGGYVRGDKLIIPGETDRGIVGNASEFLLANALSQYFRLGYDNPYEAVLGDFYHHQAALSATAGSEALTLAESQHNYTVTNRGSDTALTITLPAPKLGLKYRILRTAAQDITVNDDGSNEIVAADGTLASTVSLDAVGDRVSLEGIDYAGAVKFLITDITQN